MRWKIFILVALMRGTLFASGFDDTINWRSELPTVSPRGFSLTSIPGDSAKSAALFLRSKPYNINSLGWNYAALRYSLDKFTIFGSFGSFNLRNLYTRNRYSAGITLELKRYLAASTEIIFENERFHNIDNYFGYQPGFRISSVVRELTCVAGFTGPAILSPYKFSGNEKIRPFGSLSYYFSDDMLFSISIRRFENRRTRWFFRQSAVLAKGAVLDFGYIDSPGTLYAGLDLSMKSITLIICYYSVSRLPDTFIIGLSMGR